MTTQQQILYKHLLKRFNIFLVFKDLYTEHRCRTTIHFFRFLPGNRFVHVRSLECLVFHRHNVQCSPSFLALKTHMKIPPFRDMRQCILVYRNHSKTILKMEAAKASRKLTTMYVHSMLLFRVGLILFGLHWKWKQQSCLYQFIQSHFLEHYSLHQYHRENRKLYRYAALISWEVYEVIST